MKPHHVTKKIDGGGLVCACGSEFATTQKWKEHWLEEAEQYRQLNPKTLITQVAEEMLDDHPRGHQQHAQWLAMSNLLAHITCRLNCDANGKRDPHCSACDDSTFDHVCPPPIDCEHDMTFRRALSVAIAYREAKSEQDWEPLGEDVTMHTMYLVEPAHEDGRQCAYHTRLGAWCFVDPDTLRITRKCLRTHKKEF